MRRSRAPRLGSQWPRLLRGLLLKTQITLFMSSGLSAQESALVPTVALTASGLIVAPSALPLHAAGGQDSRNADSQLLASVQDQLPPWGSPSSAPSTSCPTPKSASKPQSTGVEPAGSTWCLWIQTGRRRVGDWCREGCPHPALPGQVPAKGSQARPRPGAERGLHQPWALGAPQW